MLKRSFLFRVTFRIVTFQYQLIEMRGTERIGLSSRVARKILHNVVKATKLEWEEILAIRRKVKHSSQTPFIFNENLIVLHSSKRYYYNHYYNIYYNHYYNTYYNIYSSYSEIYSLVAAIHWPYKSDVIRGTCRFLRYLFSTLATSFTVYSSSLM